MSLSASKTVIMHVILYLVHHAVTLNSIFTQYTAKIVYSMCEILLTIYVFIILV